MVYDDRTYDEDGERNDNLKVYDLMEYADGSFEPGDEQALVETSVIFGMTEDYGVMY